MKDNKVNRQNKSLWALSLPFLFLVLANNIVPIINTLALALVPNNGVIYSESVGVANTIYSIFSVLVSFAIGGVGIVVGQCIGRKETPAKMHEAIYTCLTIAIVMAITIFSIAEVFSPFILLGFLKKGTEQYKNAVIYIETMYIFILFAAIRCAMFQTMSNYGYVKYTITFNLISIFLDTVLTFAFVLGTNIGIIGSALGSIIACFISFILALIYFNKLITRIKFRELRINKEFAKKLLMISIPIGGERLSYNFAMFLVGLLVAQIGNKFADSFIIVEGLSRINLLNLSYTIVQTFSNVITITSIAFSQGAAIICSWKMGAKDYDSAKAIIRKAFLVSIISDVILAIILFLLRDYVLQFFQLTNPVVSTYIDQIRTITFIPFLLLIFLQIGRTINIIYITGPMSYGNLVANVIFSVINTWIVVLGIGSIMYWQSSNVADNILYGINGIYIMMTLDETIRAIFNFSWWKSCKWRYKHTWYLVKDITGKRYIKRKY